MITLCICLISFVLILLAFCFYAVMQKRKEYTKNIVYNAVCDMDSCIFFLNNEFHCIYANRVALEVFGMNDKEILLQVEECCKGWIEENTEGNLGTDIFYKKWRQEGFENQENRIFDIEYRKISDDRQSSLAFCFCLKDVTEELQEKEREQYRATHDELTGLLNRQAFYARAEEIIQSNPERKRYMVCTNIKNFKLVNDLFGEELGDRVLIDQARMLCRADYPECIHGRIHGDRFAMLIAQENFNPELAAKNTATLQYLVNESNYKIPIMIGIYPIADPMESAKVMCDKANMAISTITEDYGGKLFAFYEDKMMEKLVTEKWVTSDFDRAIRDGEFFIVLQPQVNKDMKLVGAEALVRWKHAERGLISPEEFIPVIEKSGYIYHLDRFVWEESAKLLQEFQKKGWDLPISVNICPKDFYYMDLVAEFTKLVEKYDISPRNMNLEITETVFMQDMKAHMKVLKQLSEYGFRIEIDDFGSGYSSLNQLKNMPVDILKMDMGFLQGNENQERSNTIVASMIAMAKSLQMNVIMEGVENEEQMKILALMGCELFQGYYFSKPVTVEEFYCLPLVKDN